MLTSSFDALSSSFAALSSSFAPLSSSLDDAPLDLSPDWSLCDDGSADT